MTDISIASQPQMKQNGYFVTHEKRTQDALESKRTHFSLGNHPRVTYSQSRLIYSNAAPSQPYGQVQALGSRQQSQQSNFELGVPQLRNAFYLTTYNQSSDLNVYKSFQPSKKIDNKNFASSIQYGGASKPAQYCSQSTRIYRPHTAYRPPQSDKDFIKHIKSNHFEFGAVDSNFSVPNHYTSVTMASYNNKGNASELRAKLDEAKKNDLRQNHFHFVGREPSNQVSLMKASYRPMSAAAATLNQEQRAQLRQSHWGVGEKATTQVGSAQPFITNNMLNFRWVQPSGIKS